MARKRTYREEEEEEELWGREEEEEEELWGALGIGYGVAALLITLMIALFNYC